MSGFDNDVVYANNADFSRAGSGGGLAANGLQLDGQLWIGGTAVNAGGTNINVGRITSTGGTLTVTNGKGTINIDVVGGGFPWTDVTTATQTIAVENGYVTDRGGGVVYTLPATATFGSEFIIVGKLGLTTITPNANQQILIASVSGTVGVTGTAVGTNVGDSITFRCITAGGSTVWRAQSYVGNWTLS